MSMVPSLNWTQPFFLADVQTACLTFSDTRDTRIKTILERAIYPSPTKRSRSYFTLFSLSMDRIPLQLYERILEDPVSLDLQKTFHLLPERVKGRIYEQVWILANRPLGDAHYGKHHVFDSLFHFHCAVTTALHESILSDLTQMRALARQAQEVPLHPSLIDKFFELPPDLRNEIYEEMSILADHSQEDTGSVESHISDHHLLFCRAVQRVAHARTPEERSLLVGLLDSMLSFPVPTSLQEQCSQLSSSLQHALHKQVWLLADKPLGDPYFGKHHVFDSFLIFCQALDGAFEAYLTEEVEPLDCLQQECAKTPVSPDVQQAFLESPVSLRNEVYLQVSMLASEFHEDPSLGELHVFEQIDLFYQALAHVMATTESLQQGPKKRVCFAQTSTEHLIEKDPMDFMLTGEIEDLLQKDGAELSEKEIDTLIFEYVRLEALFKNLSLRASRSNAKMHALYKQNKWLYSKLMQKIQHALLCHKLQKCAQKATTKPHKKRLKTFKASRLSSSHRSKTVSTSSSR